MASIITKENKNPGLPDQTLSSWCSEDESNYSHELCGGASSSLSQNNSTALKLSGKSRSSRGPATDLGELQVDISTILEEAVQYVKFIQVQI